MARSNEIKTPLCRFSFVNLLKPRTNDEGKTQYSAALLFPKGSNLTELQEAAVAVAVEEWGEKAKQMIKDGLIKSPFLDGDGPQGLNKKSGERHDGFAGTTFIRVMSGADYAPKLVNRKLQPVTSKDEIYSGAYGHAVVNAFTWESPKQGKGVSFGISMAQVTKDGDRLEGGGGGDPTKFFDKIEDEGDAPAETKSGQGAGGLFA